MFWGAACAWAASSSLSSSATPTSPFHTSSSSSSSSSCCHNAAFCLYVCPYDLVYLLQLFYFVWCMQEIFQNAIIQTHYITAAYITIKASKYFNIKILPAEIKKHLHLQRYEENIKPYQFNEQSLSDTGHRYHFIPDCCETYFYIPTRVSIKLKPNNTAFYKGESKFGFETCLTVLFLFRLLYKRQIMCMPSMSSEYLLDWLILKQRNDSVISVLHFNMTV